MKVLILASGLSAKEINNYEYRENGWKIVAVSNAWMAYEDWDYWVRSSDFYGKWPPPRKEHQVDWIHYRKILDKYGGHEACGYSITLAASYYALHELKPSVIGYLGADMNYAPDKEGNTHVYGVGLDIKSRGVPDPDNMVSIWNKGNPNYLHDIYMRFHDIAKDEGCAVHNFSSFEETRLPYPKATPSDFE